ncbi:MAG: UxaA family hydrolase, partial [Sphaerochaetaceae bacterium]|nr:UxaA family hydrolase [Sphaerochaetaceae bacterium]
DIPAGSHVHTHNIRTLLNGDVCFSDKKTDRQIAEDFRNECIRWKNKIPEVNVYQRKNGDIGIRNELWIVPTVGCVNGVAKVLQDWGNANLGIPDGVFAWTHPYGCSQTGDDLENTRKILAGLVRHPNAGGVLVLGLGCENNTMEEFKKAVGEVDLKRVKFVVAQEHDDEIEFCREIMKKIAEEILQDKRTHVSASKLRIGLKCGGSDGFSGITANPLTGLFCNRFCAMGGSVILTEIPEMFGAEQVILQRAVSHTVQKDFIELVKNFRNYYTSHGQPVYENPSPGNIAGGISTLEDKSLGCVQKGGNAPVTDILCYGDIVSSPGTTMLYGPGNDIVSTTAQAASGVHMIIFTTGRGTPLGAPVPVIKIASNSDLASHKNHWTDFDAGGFSQENAESLTSALFDLVIETASGKKTKNEVNGYREIAIFKDGVTL